MIRHAKRIASLALALLLLLALLPGGVFASDIVARGSCGGEDEDGNLCILTWTLDSFGVFTVSGKGEMAPYTSPSEVPWADYAESIESVVIESGVTSLAFVSFYGCKNLWSVKLSDTVEHIGAMAFVGCSSLYRFTVDDDNPAFCSVDGILYSKIKNRLLVYPASKKGSYTIPEGVIEIGDYAFYGCAGLSAVSIPEQMRRIGDCAFAGCSSLKKAVIPAGVTELGFGVFSECPALLSITAASGSADFSSADGVLFNKDGTVLLQYPGGKTGSYTVPAKVKKIERNAFCGCAGLTGVTVHDGVREIGMYAFYGCSALTSFRVPSGLDTIDTGMFSDCSSLTSVTIPACMTRIAYSAFYGCGALTDVYFGGDRTAWSAVWISNENEALTAATIHYESDGPAEDAEPGDIASVTVTPQAGGRITLSWSASANAKTYILQRHERGSSVWTTLAGSISGTSFTDSTGEAGKVYQYRVRGRNGNEFGAFKTSAEVAAMSGSTPGAVGTPTVKALAGGRITVSWTAAEGAATYILQRNERGSSTWTTLASNLKETSYTDTNAKLGKVYRYRVRSRNVSAFGPFKVSVEVAFMSGSAPCAVSSVTVTAAAKKITVSWGTAEGAATYIVQRKERGSDTWTTLNSNVKEMNYVDTTGEVGKVYQYRVRSRNVSAYGPFKASAEVGFMAGSTPGDISKVTVSASSGKITVTWTASSGAAGYIVQRRVKGASAWENLSTNVTELSYVDKSVKAGTTYQYRVRPRNGSIYGNFKASAEVTAQ